MIQFKKQKAKKFRCYTCSKYFKHYFFLCNTDALNTRIRLKFWLKNLRTSRFPNRLPYKEITSFSIPFMCINDVFTVKGNFRLLRGIAYKYIIYFLFHSKLKLLKCLSLNNHLFFRVLLQYTLNSHQNQGLIRFLFIWTLVPIQKDLGDLICPRFQETDNFILNQPSKFFLGLLKSTSNCELENMSLRKSASSMRIFSMENWR